MSHSCVWMGWNDLLHFGAIQVLTLLALLVQTCKYWYKSTNTDASPCSICALVRVRRHRVSLRPLPHTLSALVLPFTCFTSTKVQIRPTQPHRVPPPPVPHPHAHTVSLASPQRSRAIQAANLGEGGGGAVGDAGGGGGELVQVEALLCCTDAPLQQSVCCMLTYADV